MRSGKEKYLFYVVVCASLMPILFLRDFTPSNELRYLSIADEALLRHTFFTFTNHGAIYTDKPPLYLWALMLCRWLTGGHRLWLLSLLSLVPAIATVHVMDRWVSSEVDGRMRVVARMMLLSSGLFLCAALTLRMDMLMCLFIVLSLRSLWRMIMQPERAGREHWLFPLYIFLAVFTKGPVGLFVPICSSAVFLWRKKSLHTFFHYWDFRTWGVLLVCVAVWFSAICWESGTDYLHNLLVHQTMGRIVNSFHHNEPIYYYFISIWYCIAPWSLLVVGVIAAALRRGMVLSDMQRYFLTVSVTTFIMLGCISSKLHIYLLPTVPFMIYSVAMLLPRFHNSRWPRLAVAVPASVLVLALPAWAFSAYYGLFEFLQSAPCLAAACTLTACGVSSLFRLYRYDYGVSDTVRVITVGLFATVFFVGMSMPEINKYTGYGNLCDKAKESAHEIGASEYLCYGIRRAENMNVYLHQDVKVLSEDEVNSLELPRPAVVMTTKKNTKRFGSRDIRTTGGYAVVVIR